MSEKKYDLIIIGAGPAGIATAVESYVLGMRNILLLEKDENHNATIRKFYKDKKRVDKDWKGQEVELDGTIYFMDGTKESTLDFFDSLLDNNILELRTHTEVQKIEKIDNGFEVAIAGGSVKAPHVVVTIGRMGKPNKPSYKIPSSIKLKVDYTLDNCSSNENVMIVGGGDSAIEYAVDLCGHNELSICYRRDSFVRASPLNQKNIEESIKMGGIKPMLNLDIEGLEESEGRVQVNFTNGEIEIVDRVVYAIGGTTPSGFLQSSGIDELDGKPVHDDNYETNVKNLFVAGDITQESGGSIALGLNHGFAIAHYIMGLK